MKKLIILAMAFGMALAMQANDHVMDATKPAETKQAPASLSLSLKEAQDYAVRENRSLRNASLAVQQAYAQRWQTIAAMLPNVDGSYSYSNYCGYSAELSMMGNAVKIDMPNVGAFTITASVGINGQGIVGALLNNIAIDMQKISLEKSETELRSNVASSYISVLVMQDICTLLDSSLNNINRLAQMTQHAVDAGAAEQTTADQLLVRVNTLKNSLNQSKRNTELALNSLKVLIAVPAETTIELTDKADDLLSGEQVVKLLGEDFNIHNNLNYQLLEKNTDIARTNVHMAGWAYGPTLSLAYNYTTPFAFPDVSESTQYDLESIEDAFFKAMDIVQQIIPTIKFV